MKDRNESFPKPEADLRFQEGIVGRTQRFELASQKLVVTPLLGLSANSK